MSVVTNQLRQLDPEELDGFEGPVFEGDPEVWWTTTETLAVLGPKVLFDDSPPLSLRRLQIHISIGQAF